MVFTIENRLLKILLLCFITLPAGAIEPNEVLFVVLSQPNSYSSNLAESLKRNVLSQATDMKKKSPIVLLTHLDFPAPSSWTVLPLLPKITQIYNLTEDRTHKNKYEKGFMDPQLSISQKDELSYPIKSHKQILETSATSLPKYKIKNKLLKKRNASHYLDPILKVSKFKKNINREAKDEIKIKWVFICEDRTDIRLNRLLKILGKENHNREMYMGHALYDREASIIHHFAFIQDPTVFKYPHVGAGMALSRKLVSSITQKLAIKPIQNDFSIDASHELSLYILDITKLIHVREFCSEKYESEDCATFPKPFETCGDMVPKGDLYFAVKTCEKFHKERLPIVQKTWGDKAEHVIYFSEKQDNTIPTVGLDIPNTEAGHCLKTMTIFRKILNGIKDGTKSFIKWIILADDDTILSVSRMRDLLSCYDHTKSSIIGERYGYVLHSKEGYNYITGGGGMALTVSLLEKIIKRCKCPSPKSPDDMLLGLCLTRLKDVEIIHSPYFHQARPIDYAPEYLKSSKQISFHKHWMIDPLKVYEQWFQNSDLQMTKAERVHAEL